MLKKPENGKRIGFAGVLFARTVILKDFILSGIKLFLAQPCWLDSRIRKIVLLSLALNIFLWIYLAQNKIESDFPVILHYNPLFGVDFLGSYEKIYLLPLVGVIIFALNSILCHLLYSREKLASYFLVFNILLAQGFLLFAAYLVVRVNS